MTDLPLEPDTSFATLANGVRVVAMRLPYLDSVSVSVFVRTGSAHESRRLNGVSHFVEHMAFKGTHERDCQQINLDAERLGAEVNAHTDKDHTAYHLRGLADHAGRFLEMLADIVRHSSFPAAELERERQVILHEYVEDEEDPLSAAFTMFDKVCFGAHPVAQAVIGTRANIERLTRADLLDYVQRQYTGSNVIVGVAGGIDPDLVMKQAAAVFGSMATGSENRVAPAVYVGGCKTRRQSGCSQTQVVLGFPIPTLKDDDPASGVAAALFGEGMSSPLLDQIRERRGLVYHAACSADVMEPCGQFVIEAATMPEHLDEFFGEVSRLLAVHAETVDPVGLERARNQIAVRNLGNRERPFRRLEEAAQDLFVYGRIRSSAEQTARVRAVTAAQVRDAFERMLAAPPAVAMAGKLPAHAGERALELLGACAR